MSRSACLMLVALAWSHQSLGDVHVAVASNFAQPAKQIAANFERNSGHKVRLSFGSSGKLYAQIVNGAPFDVFLSADEAKPNALEQHGLVALKQTYAIGRLVLWVLEPMQASRDPDLEANWEALSGQIDLDQVGKISLANPRLAPYGLAAQQTLNSLGLGDLNRKRLVTGENIAQAFQFVSTGNARVGFIAQSQVGNIPAGRGSIVLVPNVHHDPIKQVAVLLQRNNDSTRAAVKPEAEAFFAYLASQESKDLIKEQGYEVAP